MTYHGTFLIHIRRSEPNEVADDKSCEGFQDSTAFCTLKAILAFFSLSF